MKLNEESKLDLIVQRMRADRSVDAPADVVKYAKNLYRTWSPEPKQTLVRRLFGALTVDLASGKAAFGERSATTEKARQLLYESGDVAVDLRIKATGSEFELRGQVIGEGFENSQVEIKSEKATGRTMTNRMSEFKLAGLPAGVYSLSIRSNHTEIVLENIAVS